MPAASEAGAGPAAGAPDLPRTWRPLGPRIVGIALTLSLAAACVGAAVAFGPETRAAFTRFQIGTLCFLALLALATIYALLRSRVVARPEGLLLVNGYRRREVAWAEVVAVRLPPGAPWVTLDLADGSSAAAMGIQGSDGERARAAVREIRRLVAERSGPA